MKQKILLTADWCGPCHMLKNKINAQNLTVETMEMQDNMDIVGKYKIRSVPTLLVIEEDGTFYTATGSDDIIEEIKRKEE